ncbi:hypothetical protein [Terrimonas pollutisoli]|uniref:hypothetical protein n=1 Tax=Terrimonas pollutisoli TaxID=3034147 RepID=UPI0023EB3AF8|nr:hypothetical protein [Terrimonas sp. H1YJ31]
MFRQIGFLQRQLIFSTLLFLSFQQQLWSQGATSFTTSYFKINVDRSGYITQILNLSSKTNRNFSNTEKKSPLLCLYNSRTKEYFYPQTCSYQAKEKQLTLKYSNGSVALIKIEPQQKYIKLTLKDVRNRNGIDAVEWGTIHTTINNLFGEIIGVARDTSRAVNFSIGLLALNDITTGGPANSVGDSGGGYYTIHTPDAKRFPLPDSLHEGDLFTMGGDGRNDVAFYSRPEEFFRIVSGNSAFIDKKGNVSIAYHAQDRRSEKMILYPAPITLKKEDAQQSEFIKTNYPIHQLTQALPGIDYIGSSIALWGAPDTEALAVLENIVLNEKLPHPTVNGKWIKDPSAFIPDVSWAGNYDSCLSYTRQLGFKAVQGEGLGEFYPNRSNNGHINWKLPYKSGKQEIKPFTDEALKYGVLFGLHTLNNFLQNRISSDVSPVPNDSLCKVFTRKLAKPVTATDTLLYVDDPTYMNEYGGWEGHTENVLKIGKELIHYKGVSAAAPYYLTGVKRGYWNTKATNHQQGAVIEKLMTNCYGGLAPDMFLQDQLAVYYAQLSQVNTMHYIDLDGEEGFLYQGHGNYAYKRFFNRFFEECKKRNIPYMRVMGAGVTEGAWHYQSVWNVGGGTNMYFIRNRKWAIEGKDIRNIAFANYFPSTFGITESLRPNSTVQEWENLQALSVGVGVTYMMNLSEKTVEACTQKYAIFKAIRIWENARAANAFTAAVKAKLANTDKEFHLEQLDERTWKLYEVWDGRFVNPVLLTADKRK